MLHCRHDPVAANPPSSPERQSSMQQQMRPQQHHCPLPQRAPVLQLQPGRAPRHRAGRLSCYARRTVSGSSDTGTNKGSPIKRPADSSNGKASRSSKASQVVVKPPATPSQQQQQRQQHTNSSRGTQGPQRRQQPNKRSAIEEFMRTTPGQSTAQSHSSACIRTLPPLFAWANARCTQVTS